MKKSIVLLLSLCLFVGGLQAMYLGAPKEDDAIISNQVKTINEARAEIAEASEKIRKASHKIRRTIKFQRDEVEDLQKIAKVLTDEVDDHEAGFFSIRSDVKKIKAIPYEGTTWQGQRRYLRDFFFDKKKGVIMARYLEKDAEIRVNEFDDRGASFTTKISYELPLWNSTEGQIPQDLLSAFKGGELKVKKQTFEFEK